MEQKKNLQTEKFDKRLQELNIEIQLQTLRKISVLTLMLDMLEARTATQRIKKNKEKVFYTTEEVMEMLCISRKTLYTFRKEGKIKCIKTENTIRFSKEEIEKYRATLSIEN